MKKYIIDSVKTEKFEMNYLKFGTGDKTFIMLPGMSLTSVLDSADGIVSAYNCLCSDYTVYLFDRVKNVREGYSIEDMAEDTVDAIKELGLNDLYIFGVSQGGMIALCMAVHHSELVKKMIVASSFSRHNVLMENIFSEWINYAENEQIKELNHSFYINLFSKEYIEKYGAILESFENNGTADDCKKFIVIAKACLNFDIYDELDKIKCPVLVIGSNNDRVLSGESSVEIAEKIGCELYM
ncbi:MAG: alpha/beta hydrolase, partial [Ruminococcus sp.]|nr:alpha/beta hydrolase [Candidatus Copronaster equi]